MKNRKYRFSKNPEEKRFATAWDREDCLRYLLADPSPHAPIPEPTKREIEVAAVVIQWLGSPVGQCFLRDLGYTKSGDTNSELIELPGPFKRNPTESVYDFNIRQAEAQRLICDGWNFKLRNYVVTWAHPRLGIPKVSQSIAMLINRTNWNGYP